MTRARLWAARVGLAIVAVLGLAMVAASLMPWYFSRPRKIPHSAPTNVAALAGDPFVSPEPVVPSQPHREWPREALVGPVFEAGAGTREVKLDGLPFTFVVPRSWGCLRATVPVNAAAWRCVDEQAGQGRAQVDVAVRHCPGPCTGEQRAETDRAVTDLPIDRTRDAATRFGEHTVDGRYVLAVDRVFATSAGGAAEWLLVVEARARPEDAATVQKIVNDVYSQTVR
jgi:hypothetical protein